MDPTTDDRLRSVVLVGVTVAALVAGGWWWRAAAPTPAASSARPPAATPSVEPTVSSLERLLPSTEPDDSVTFRVDPETGEVLEIRRPTRTFDPQVGATLGTGDAPGDLPVFEGTIWRQQGELIPGQDVTRQSTNDGARYLLQYRCTRPGAMMVTSTGAAIAGPSHIDCDGTMATAEVLPAGGPIRVSLTALGDHPIDAEAQLFVMP
ncbi:hypothetical protein JOD64_002526 [Micromonospora luteifusca]|uniref:Serine/threonine protein kinase n=1 Tax=Micromonospora luteifusca TaxID=709860 RepID=A0ABS2LTR6_9ACTN|nr:hypothetical protein [Micromonospora luteifusca]MBM7491304.1 hypothetical protein [Micromonospora luteifusca]